MIMRKKDGNKSRFALGQKFRVVKNGLDENEVMPFIASLIEQNHDYAKKLQHLDGLTKLAERAIIEAGTIAEARRAEIAEKAHEEAAAILADAQGKVEQALAEAERLAQQALKQAEAEADEINSAAKGEAIAIVSAARHNAEEVAMQIATAAADQRRQVTERLLSGVHELMAETEKETLANAQEAEALLQRAAKLANEIRQRIGSVFDDMIETLNLNIIAEAGGETALGEEETTGPEQKEKKSSRRVRARV